MSIAWRKVYSDVRLQRRRVIAVAVAVAVGTAALSTALGARAVLRREIAQAGAVRAPASRRSRIRGVVRSLAWRGLFRKRARLAVTLGALALGGAALMTAVNVYRGLVATVDTALARRGDDLEARLLRPAPAEALRRAVAAIPGVRRVEIWGATLAATELDAGGASAAVTSRYSILAAPPDTRHFGATLVRGREIESATASVVLVSRAVLAAVAIALPLTAAVQEVLGDHGLFVSMPDVFSPAALAAWIAIAAVVLLAACVIPTRRARFAPVQDVLAHE